MLNLTSYKRNQYNPSMKTNSILLFGLINILLATTGIAQECKHENMGEAINSAKSDNSPKISPDGKTLYFLRWRSQDEKSKDYGHDIWRSELGDDGKWQPAVKLGKPFNTGSYNAVEAVGRNGSSLLLHGAFKKGVPNGRGFSMSVKTEKGWTKPQQLIINNYDSMAKGKYSGATMSNDGTVLVLAMSETKDSEDNDLYVSFLQKDGTWSTPKNMGKTINSDKGEAGAFISVDGATLYFSSNRSGGVGCYDIYMTTRKDNTWENWTEPKNLGPSVNTNVCDIHFSLDAKEEYAYLGTMHDSKFGDEDIVKVKLEDSLKPKKDLDILVYDSTAHPVQAINNTPGKNHPATADSNKTITTTNNSTANALTQDNFRIYPNPTDVNFFLELNGTFSSKPLLTIMDMEGKLIITKELDHLDGIYTERFDVSSYARGIYIVTITDGRSLLSKKLVIK